MGKSTREGERGRGEGEENEDKRQTRKQNLQSV